MKHLLAFLVVLISASFLNSQVLVGQSDVTQSSTRTDEVRFQAKNYWERKGIAVENIRNLKNGTLIVRLITYNEKIEMLEKAGRTEKAQELKTKSNEVNSWFISEFNNDYNFSDVVFCYGVDLKKYIDGEKTDVFLNEQLEVDSNIIIKPGPIYIFAAQASDSYYLYDKEYRRIPEPAPHAINQEERDYDNKNKQFSIDRILEMFTGVDPLENSVRYFNAKLNRLVVL